MVGGNLIDSDKCHVAGHAYPYHALSNTCKVSLHIAFVQAKLTLLHQVTDCTNFSKIVFVPSVPEQHSSLFTGGFGGEREIWTDTAVRKRRAALHIHGDQILSSIPETLSIIVIYQLVVAHEVQTCVSRMAGAKDLGGYGRQGRIRKP